MRKLIPILSIFLLLGCSTIGARMDGIKSTFEIPLPGTATDLMLTQTIAGPFAIMDLPFSFTLDILIFPYDVLTVK